MIRGAPPGLLRESSGSGAGEREDGDVVVLTEALGDFRDIFGGQAYEVRKAVKAEELAPGGARFGDSVREQDEALAAEQLAGNGAVGLVGCEAEGERGRRGELAAFVCVGDIRREMAGVGDGEGARRGEQEAAGGGEADLARAEKRLVEAGEDRGGIARGFAAEDAEDERDAQGGSEAFAGDIADDGGEGPPSGAGETRKKSPPTSRAGR